MPDHMYACGGESHERGEREAYRLMHPRVDFGLPGECALTSTVPYMICVCSEASYTVLWWDAWVLPSWSANLAWELY